MFSKWQLSVIQWKDEHVNKDSHYLIKQEDITSNKNDKLYIISHSFINI